MNFGLGGKTALVTGSTVGIGYATALALVREGAQVVVNGRTQARVDDARRRILQEVPSARVQAVAADLSSAQGCDTLLKAVPQVDVLVNNVGIFEPKPFAEISDADWLRFFETNVLSGVRLARHYFPKMLERGWGRVVFVSSESAVQIPAEMIHYGMTKTAQVAVARGMAELTTGTRVTVNTVLPGPTLSEGVGQFVTDLARNQGVSVAEVERGFFDQARPTSILQRFIQPDEVANLIAYVCSDKSSATNGAALRVDGGVVKALL